MNLNVLEKLARQVLNSKTNNTFNTQLTSAEQRAVVSPMWKINPGGAAAGTLAMEQPLRAWG